MYAQVRVVVRVHGDIQDSEAQAAAAARLIFRFGPMSWRLTSWRPGAFFLTSTIFTIPTRHFVAHHNATSTSG